MDDSERSSGRGGDSGGGAFAVILFAYLIIFFSPIWMVLFFCQRVLISPKFIKSLLKFAVYTFISCFSGSLYMF
jgi:hypothetical protein